MLPMRFLRTMLATPLLAWALAAAPAAHAQDGGDPEGDVSLEEIERLVAEKKDAWLSLAKKEMARLDRTYGEGFWLYLYDDPVPRPYLVAAEKKPNVDPETIAREYGEILGSLYKVFYENFGELLGIEPIRRPIVVLVYDSKDSYRRMRESRPDLGLPNEEFIAGYYSPETGILTQWRQPNLWEVMFHEGTHQLVDYSRKKWNVPHWQISPWFNEGFADFMSGHESELVYDEEQKKFVRTFRLGRFIKHRFATLQDLLLSGDALSLRDLVHLDYLTFQMAWENQAGNGENQRLTSAVYAEGWGLCMFLNWFDDGKYRETFHEFMRDEIHGKGGGERFEELFYLESEEDWADFQAEFEDFVFTDLRRMGRKKKSGAGR